MWRQLSRDIIKKNGKGIGEDSSSHDKWYKDFDSAFWSGTEQIYCEQVDYVYYFLFESLWKMRRKGFSLSHEVSFSRCICRYVVLGYKLKYALFPNVEMYRLG